jgi:hypothetical protein
VIGLLRAVILGLTSIAILLAAGPQLHRRLADRPRKRQRQILHKPKATKPPLEPTCPYAQPMIIIEPNTAGLSAP